MAFLKALWSRFAGGDSRGAAEGIAEAPRLQCVDYKGYRIRPAPYRVQNQYQTAGVIEKDFPDGVKTHEFVRAETHASRDDAAAFATAKARQIIDQLGDGLFDRR